MHLLGVVRPEAGGAHSARTSIAILFFVFLTACGGGGSGGGGVPDATPPAPGTLDSSFSTDGIVTTTIGTFDSASALAPQSDGKIVVAGSAMIGGVENVALARYKTDGTLDTTFGTGGIVTTLIGTNSSAAALGLQADGKIVVAGKATIGGVENFALARYNSNGTLDTTFDTDGIVTTPIGTNSSAAALGLQADGKIVVAGKATIGGVENFALARYNPTVGALDDGDLDPSFGLAGTGIVNTIIPGMTSSNAFALGLQTDGKIVVAGTATSDGLAHVFALARYTSTGVLDTTFGTSGIVTTIVGATSSNAFALALQSDGKIVAAGNATNFGVEFFVALARYTSTGVLDTTFGTSGIVTTTIGALAGASAVALQSDAKIVAAGISDGSIALARYNP